MVAQKYLINNKHFFFFTYASTWNDTLTLGKLTTFWENKVLKNHPNAMCIIAHEGPDDEIARDHFHGLIYDPEKTFSIRKSTLDVPLEHPVIAYYKKEIGGGEVLGYKNWKKEYGLVNDNEECNNCIDLGGAGNWKLLYEGHPNLKQKEFGTYLDIFDYVTKKINQYSAWSTHGLQIIREELLKLDVKNKKPNGKRGRPKKEPNWEAWKKEGLTLEDVKRRLKTEYPNEVVKYWYKWKAGVEMVFGREKREIQFDENRTYYIPVTVYSYLINVVRKYNLHKKDRKWLESNRLERPGSLIWIGPSQIGKTYFLRAVTDNNYFQFSLNDFQTFDEDKPVVILDDFSRNIPSHLPSWKCWLGCQTDFTVNPKYEKRRTIAWGHPCIFLTNYKKAFTEDNGFDKDSDLDDYIPKNCTFVTSGKRKLWEKPPSEDYFKYRKVTIKEMKTLMEMTDEEIKEFPPVEQVLEEALNKGKEPESEITLPDNEVNEPILIESDNEESTSEGRPQKKRSWIYVEELPEDKANNYFKTPKIRKKN